MWGRRSSRTSLGAKPKEGQSRGRKGDWTGVETPGGGVGVYLFPMAVTVRPGVLELASVSGTEDSPGF